MRLCLLPYPPWGLLRARSANMIKVPTNPNGINTRRARIMSTPAMGRSSIRAPGYVSLSLAHNANNRTSAWQREPIRNNALLRKSVHSCMLPRGSCDCELDVRIKGATGGLSLRGFVMRRSGLRGIC